MLIIKLYHNNMFIELAVMTMTFFTGMVLIILNPLKQTRLLGWLLLLQALGRTYMGLGFLETMLLIALGCLMLFLMRNFKEYLLAKISYYSLGLALVMDFILLW